jgi:hypothetical protein
MIDNIFKSKLSITFATPNKPILINIAKKALKKNILFILDCKHGRLPKIYRGSTFRNYL